MADLFLAEHRLPRMSESELMLLQAALHTACVRLTARGESVTYLGSTFLPASQRLLSLFEATGANTVRRVTDSAQAPPTSVEPAIDLPNQKED